MSRFPAAHAILLDAIAGRAFPGATFGVLLRDEPAIIESSGRFTYEPSAPPVLPETIFDLASLTKVLATTAMAMLLFERGRLDLDQPVGNHLPAFVENEPAESPKRVITAKMLLAHNSGLPAYARLYETCRTAHDLQLASLAMPLEASPGERTLYSDIGFIVLGLLLESIAHEPLDRFCRREVFTPLAMQSTLYNPPPGRRSSIPPTGIDQPPRHRLLQGKVHDDNCSVLGDVAGHAGLFSSAADVLRFARAILEPGLFHPETLALFTAHAPGARALGWDVPTPPSSSGRFFSTNSVGHLGYTGTSLWIDLDRKLAIVLLTNRTFPGNQDRAVFQQIQTIRPRFHDAILEELGLASQPT